MYALWFIVLFEPQWLLAYYAHMTPLLKVPTVLFALITLLSLFSMRGGIWMWPFALFIIVGAIDATAALNTGYARAGVKLLYFSWIIGVAGLIAIKNYKDIYPLLLMMPLQYLWWGINGVATGAVPWHTTYANPDGYGPLMVVGIGLCLYFGMAWKNKRWKWLFYFLSALSVAGVVSSFARGAFLSACLVLVYIWIRSPKKGVVTAGAFAAVLVMVVVSPFINGASRDSMAAGHTFWQEMATISNGSSDATGNDREVLWAAARKVFAEHPILGVGANNFGTNAATYFHVGDVGGAYADNPKILYDRRLHSIYFEILSEFGIVGSLAYLWMLIDFWRLNAKLRTRPFREHWVQMSGGQTDIRLITLGLEAGMVAYLATGVFYDQLFQQWGYAFYALTCVLYAITKPAPVRINRGSRVVPRPA